MRFGVDGSGGFYAEFGAKIPLHIDNIAAITLANLLFDHMLGTPLMDAAQFYIDRAREVLALLPDEIEIKDSERAKNFIRDWILSNPKNFTQTVDEYIGKDLPHVETDSGFSGYTLFGAWRKDYIAVFPSVIKQELDNAGFSSDMILKQLADEGYIIRGDAKHITKAVRIGDTLTRMICIDIKHFDVQSEADETLAPVGTGEI